MRKYVALVLVLLAVGCSSAPEQMTVHGTVKVANSLSGPSVSDGSQVTVTDSGGHVIGTAGLNQQSEDANVVIFTFTVKVPGGESSYSVTVSGMSGTQVFTQKEMQTGPSLCEQDACAYG